MEELTPTEIIRRMKIMKEEVDRVFDDLEGHLTKLDEGKSLRPQFDEDAFWADIKYHLNEATIAFNRMIKDV